MLYHGTLIRHLQSIATDGLVPSVGEFTKKVYGENARGVLPAVFMADEEGLERVVHALVAAVMGEITDEDDQEYEIGPHYHLNDELFFKYAALVHIEESEGFARAGLPLAGSIEPEQAEDGDWYSLSPVVPVKVLAGHELAAFYAARGLAPSTINDFVDPESVRRVSALRI
jgi:hypothetical protein